jgi:hypothetical protein
MTAPNRSDGCRRPTDAEAFRQLLERCEAGLFKVRKKRVEQV